MRIDILNNTKAIVQSAKRRSMRRWIIFAGIILGMGYLCILLSTYVLKPSDASDQDKVNQYEGSVIRVDAFVAPGPSKHASGRTIAVYHTNYRRSGLINHEVEPVNPTAALNSNRISNSQTAEVYTTSTAITHNLGAGINTGSRETGTTAHVSSAIPFSTSTSSLVMPTAVWTSSRALSVQNTRQSEQQLIAANSAEAPSHHGNIRRWGGTQEHDADPFLDPLGDEFGVLLLAAVVYTGAILILRRKQQAK